MTYPAEDKNCRVCGARGVTEFHVTRCEQRAAEHHSVTRAATEAGVDLMRALDLLAHVRSGRGDDPAAIVRAVIDLGWRPVIGAGS